MRVRLQTTKGNASLVGTVKDVFRNGGIRAFYTGLTASIFRQMTYSLTRLGAYDLIKAQLSNTGAKKLTMGDLVLASAGAGALGGLAGNPADVLLVRMIADPTKPKDKQFRYRNALHGLYRMVKDEGAASLFRGVVPNTIRAVLMNSSQLVSYDVFKGMILQNTDMKDGIPVHFLASALAGTVATTICSPADVIKSRVMAREGPGGPMKVLKKSWQKEGPRFLFKGWLPAWIRLTPNTIFMFVFLEQLRHVVDTVREQVQ
ncbi:hypothetical protein VHUM_02426 [Vanrija humicola]|uniref:Mitochondrial dicarboxylate transporter n=1 Tax=Vanrija humicola TaxID=5417 RepID=A0A7D8V0A6_VANHU|nr:hypothetical protein VHUM_02426 [Vanrija humicola]